MSTRSEIFDLKEAVAKVSLRLWKREREFENVSEDLAAVCKHLNIQVKTIDSKPRYRKASFKKTPKRKSK